MRASGRPHRREAPIFFYCTLHRGPLGPLGSNQGTFQKEAPPTNRGPPEASKMKLRKIKKKKEEENGPFEKIVDQIHYFLGGGG